MYPFLHLDLPTGDFFYRNRVARRLPSRSAGFILLVSTRALRAQKIPKNSKHFFFNSGKFHKIVKEFRRFQKKIAKMLQIPPSEREPGGASLILGLPLYFVLRKEPHMKVSLKSKNVSNFSQNWEKSEHFQPRFWKLSKTSSDHHAAGFLKTDLKFWDQKAKTLF